MKADQVGLQVARGYQVEPETSNYRRFLLCYYGPMVSGRKPQDLVRLKNPKILKLIILHLLGF